MRDVFTDALNAPAGQLAEIVLRKVRKGSGGGELSSDVSSRLNRLVDARGLPGHLARVRLAAEVAFLFEIAPQWTTQRILPLFHWSSMDASDMWEARKYSGSIGSPKLFSLIKAPFLEMFGRGNLDAEDLRVFAEWLVVILIMNRSSSGTRYPLSGVEARAALRRAGAEALVSVGHRLAIEMESAPPPKKAEHWKSVVGPVFQEIWPLDIELQTPLATYKLVQLLEATGASFADAADVVLPFVQSDGPRSHSLVHSLANAPDEMYASSPRKMLDLAAAAIGDAPAGSVYGLGEILSRIRKLEPALADTRKFQRLLNCATS